MDGGGTGGESDCRNKKKENMMVVFGEAHASEKPLQEMLGYEHQSELHGDHSRVSHSTAR